MRRHLQRQPRLAVLVLTVLGGTALTVGAYLESFKAPAVDLPGVPTACYGEFESEQWCPLTPRERRVERPAG